jgi:hypothetical protein
MRDKNKDAFSYAIVGVCSHTLPHGKALINRESVMTSALRARMRLGESWMFIIRFFGSAAGVCVNAGPMANVIASD